MKESCPYCGARFSYVVYDVVKKGSVNWMYAQCNLCHYAFALPMNKEFVERKLTYDEISEIWENMGKALRKEDM